MNLLPTILAISLGAGVATSAQAIPQEKGSPAPNPRDAKKKEEKLRAELGPSYRQTLDELRYILTDGELAAFNRLSTNEERDKLIEIIWDQHDPTPETVENEFREEHYRRIAYANERFSSGIPGWKTDRGRIYIIWGPADEVESHPSGGSYNRSYEEGGGSTSVHPFERWRYRHLEGLGDNIVWEFVDPSGSGEFRLTMDPSEKDALLHVPGAGLTDAEQRGTTTRAARLTQGSQDSPGANIFDRLHLYAGAFRPPAPKNKQLDQMVTARVVRDQIRFDSRFDFFRMTANSVLVPITVQIPNHQLSFQSRAGVHAATLNLYARITTLSGRIVQTFEDVIQRDIPESLLRQSLQGSSIYQKAVPLAPGLYRLDIAIKDVNSGNIGTFDKRIAVQPFPEGQLASSTLILADLIERVPKGQLGFGPFVLGGSKVRPRVDAVFTTADTLGLYFQIYNLQMDAATRKPSAAIEYRILKNHKEIARFAESPEQLAATGEQLTVEKSLPLAGFAPGEYQVEITITDHVAKSTITPSAKFTIKPAEKAPEKTAAAAWPP